MKNTRTLLAFGLFIGLSFTACNKGTDPNNPSNNTTDTTTTDTTTTTNTGTAKATNNTIEIEGNVAAFNEYYVTRAVDVNSNKEYYDFLFYTAPYSGTSEYMRFLLTELPTETKTLSWQSGSYAPGDLKANEFSFDIKVNGAQWWGEYAVDGWATTGTAQATVTGTKLTIWFNDIELGDSFLTSSITKRDKCSGKITFDMADITIAVYESTTGPLIAE